jgi:hypothetical protein
MTKKPLPSSTSATRFRNFRGPRYGLCGGNETMGITTEVTERHRGKRRNNRPELNQRRPKSHSITQATAPYVNNPMRKEAAHV